MMKQLYSMLSLATLSLGLMTAVPSSSYGACQENPFVPCGQACESSDPYLDPRNFEPCCFGDFTIGADFIYWKPCIADLDYAAEVVGSPVIDTVAVDERKLHYKNICLDWEPGFRLRFAKPDIWCRWSFLASYTFLHGTDKRTTSAESPDYLVSPLLHARINAVTSGRYAEIKAKYTFDFQSWDLLIAYPCEICDCNKWSPFVGIEGFHYDQKLKTQLLNPSNLNGGFVGETHWKSDFHATGLKVGHDYELRFCESVSFFSRSSITLAVAEPDAHYKQKVLSTIESAGEKFHIHDNLCCQLVPGYHIQLGVAYASCLCGFEYGLRVGYEFLKWFNVPNERRFFGEESSDFALSSNYDTRSIGFHGLLIGLEVKL